MLLSLSLSRHSRREETRDDTEMSCKCAPHDSRDAVAGVRSERSKHRREKRRRGGSAACHQLLSSRRREVAGEGCRRSCSSNSSSSRRRHDCRRRITFSSETARERERGIQCLGHTSCSIRRLTLSIESRVGPPDVCSTTTATTAAKEARVS